MNIKLRKLRESRNVSQDAMASLLNISQPQYYRKE
ncbi:MULTISPECIES: helix-turn-helix domain-containing protein [unclassified Chryseobacterium]|nr:MULTISPECIES: helix-turn-helix domain-containing protein [unclassified Chryseobacterium]